MRNFLIILYFSGIATNVYSQECLENVKQYFSSIDTTERYVYTITEEMPEILQPEVFMTLLGYHSELFDSIKCCPIKVWVCFIIEPDSSMTNVKVCTKMMFCDSTIIKYESEKFNKRVIQQLSGRKYPPGRHKGTNVAVACIIPIHYECFDWK